MCAEARLYMLKTLDYGYICAHDPYIVVAIANTLRAGLQAIALAFAFKACLPDGRYRWPLSIHYPLGPSKEKRS